MRAFIVGGGIGGLSAAIALRHAGVEVVVFERASEPPEVGAGVGLWSNALRALKGIGLYEAVRGIRPRTKTAVEATEEAKILRADIYDREPVDSWGAGRATLLGDAAHPMTPHLGQGACQAIEDAAVLADCLGGTRSCTGSVAAALRLYEDRRVGRTAEIVRRSRRTGRVLQLENPLLCGLRDVLVGALSPGVTLRQMDPVVGYRV